MREPNGGGPFKPGTGRLPPYLAGRETEQEYFRECFETLRQGEPVPSEVILYGPRGNGKTTLLRWVETEAEATGGLDTYWLVGSNVPEPEGLVKSLEIGSWLRRIRPDSVSMAGVGVSLRDAGEPKHLAEALEARARAKPLLVLLDEAHTLKPAVGQWLLNAAQAAGSRAPFLLALAGTPDLRARLSEMGASFWNRGKKLAVGRLDENATAAAVERPLAAAGITVEREALERIVRESHGYPFFTQLWGQSVWRKAARSTDGARTVTMAVVNEAAAEFEAERNNYYIDRFLELHRKALLPAARAVATAFLDERQIGLAALEEAIVTATQGTERSAADITQELEHLGFVWLTKGLPMWEPGIPSLMDYILQHAPTPPGD